MGSRLQTRRDAAERSALVRLTLGYLGVFAAVVAALSFLAYLAIEANDRSMIAPALDTPEAQAGLAAAMRPVALAILSVDAFLLIAVGAASYALARAALRPMVLAREREERFAADAAHELRTPLTAIASLAQAHAGTGADDPYAAIARRAMEAGALVSDLLTLARSGEAAALVREPVDLAMIAERAAREAEADFPAVTIAGTYGGAIVDGDERRLLQLARNLIANACRHARGRVSVTTGAEGTFAVLIVEDDGPGVDPALVPRLFDRFVKGPESGGSGLGLAIVRWVARAHGGEVTYADGSRFVARLPILTGL